MDIEGLGPAMVERLVESHRVKDVADLYQLEASDLAGMEGIGEISTRNLLDAIAESKKRGLTRLLTALAIPHVGSETADILAKEFNELHNIIGEKEDTITEDDVLEFFCHKDSEKVVTAQLSARGVPTEQLTRWATMRAPHMPKERRTYLWEHFQRLPRIIELRLPECPSTRRKEQITKLAALIGLWPEIGSELRRKYTLENVAGFFEHGDVKKLHGRNYLSLVLSPQLYRISPPTVREIIFHYSRLGPLKVAGMARYFSRVAPLLKINGIDHVVAQAVVDFFDREQTKKLISRLAQSGVDMTSRSPTATTAPFNGKTFVVTGTLEKYSRIEIEELIRSLGGRAASDVGKNVDYLVVGDSPGATKIEKAAKLKVSQLTEDDFERMITGAKGRSPQRNKKAATDKPSQKSLFNEDK